MTTFDKDTLHFLHAYLDTASPSGEESEAQGTWSDRIRPWVDKVTRDPYGATLGVIGKGKRTKVVLEAHADEVGWMVNYITGTGLLHVEGTGDPAVALCRPVWISTTKGTRVHGVVGWPATHMRSKKKEPATEDLFIDVGCRSQEEVEELGIDVGCTVTYQTRSFVMQGNYLVGRALDNKIGGFMLTEVARRLNERNTPPELEITLVNSVQEEVGLHGAEMIVERTKPDLVITIDVTHDTTMPGVNKAKYGNISCGKGPVISFGATVHDGLNTLLLKAAKAADISVQRSAGMKSTGTDADAFASGGGGTRTTLLSIPVKYMHTPTEVVHLKDVDDGIELLIGLLDLIAENEQTDRSK